MSILVVEDDPGTRSIVTRALEQAGHRVIAAADGTQALDLVSKEDPALVVLDVGLPGINGFEVCRRIRCESLVPIVMLTARRSEEDILLGYSLGIDDYIIKPFSPRVLAARIASVMRRAIEGDRRERERY